MKQLSISEIKKRVIPILKESGITKSAVFGSYVRGEANEDSDIDLLVEYPKGINLFDVAELKYKLEDELEKPVDLVGYKTIKADLKPYILLGQIPIL